METENCSLIDLELVREMAVAACASRYPFATPATVFVPAGFVEKTIPAEHEMALPNHIRQRLHLVDRESFTRYVKAYRGPSSQIFATITDKGAHFVGVLDYHWPGKEQTAGHIRHIAEFGPKYSDEFAAWCAINGKALTQEQFLDHIRRWGDVITSHTDADMIEIVSNLEFTTSGSFSSKVERTTGGRKLVFNEEIEGRGETRAMTVPDSMQLTFEIFQGGEKFECGADLLYRVGGGQLKITVELKRPHKVIKEAIDSLITDIEAETDIIPLVGTVQLPG